MRITNKIVHNNSLYNINLNKTNEDTLNTMTSTGKKITRPSDDPVVAIRSPGSGRDRAPDRENQFPKTSPDLVLDIPNNKNAVF